MKPVVLSLMLALTLSAQPVMQTLQAMQDLKSDLQSLRAGPPAAAFARQVGTHILLMAEETHEPAAPTLRLFAVSLVEALSGRPLTQKDIDWFTDGIQQTMQSAGTSTSDWEAMIREFEKRLTRCGVPAARSHTVAANLERLGKDVQGPEDTPAFKPLSIGKL